MITLQQYVEALSHDDFFVRSEVLCLISEGSHKPLAATEAAIQMIDRYGWNEAYEYSSAIRALTVDDHAARWALRKAASLLKSDFAAGHHLAMWVCEKASIPLLRSVSEEVESLLASVTRKPALWSVLRCKNSRLVYAGMEPRLLLHRLERTAGDCSRTDEFPTAKVEDGMVICNELADFPDFRSCLTERAREWLCTELKEGDLTSRKDKEALWLNGFSIHLAGLLGMEEQLERLLELLKYDWDWTNELIQKALRRLRSPGVFERCARLYPSMPWQGRLFSSSVFETTCFPETETLVTGLLQAEPDDDQRVRLARALAHCGTPQSQKIARAVYAEAPDDPERFDIVRLLYAQFAILGIKDAEMEEWHRTMKDTRLRLRNARARLAPVIHEGASGSTFTELPEAYSEPKIGRNEMCPCGSAKKYKQCCLRR